MVDLIILACSIANPSNCAEKHMLFESSGSLQTCMMQAPVYFAQWVDQHPGSRVARWRCAWPDAEDQRG